MLNPVRRTLLSITAAVLVLGALAIGGVGYAWNTADIDRSGNVDFDRPLLIPPLADSVVEPDGTRVFDLRMQSGTTDLGHGQTPTWGVNGSYLGPTLRAERGERIRIDVENSLPEASTLHWHGMHLPAAMDGGPHQVIDADGGTWSPTWTVDQPAASLWYHPHLHGATADRVYRGLAGMFLIDENGPPLPDTYGVDDIPLIVQDKKFRDEELDDSSALFVNTGILGDEILVNGTPGPYLDVTSERVRLRVLNASNARVYDFAFSTGLEFDQIATDGGFLETPHRTDHLRLTPGERAEIVVKVPAGTSSVLRSEPADLGVGFWAGRFGGADDRFDILELRADENLTANATVPATLVELEDLGKPTRTREFTLAESSRINGEEMDPSRVDEVVTLGDTEIWRIHNASGQIHNFHVHDVQFQVQNPGDPSQSGAKDTVYIPPNDTVDLLMRFTDYADTTVPYMYHCHILRHEDNGMMGQFVVVEPGQEVELIPHSGHG